MDIAYTAAILLLFGCVWWELRAMRKRTESLKWDDLAEFLAMGRMPPADVLMGVPNRSHDLDAPIRNFRVNEQAASPIFENPQVRSARYERLNDERLREEAKHASQ